MSFEVQVPASSANLGPGFDSLAIAFSIHLRVQVDPDAETRLPKSHLDLLGGEDLIALAMQHLAGRFERELPPCSIETSTDIPVARGLGSSAAAIVAGLQIGAILTGMGELPSEELIDIGGAMEGHADNVSAAVLGGVTAAIEAGNSYIATRIAVDLPWQPLLFVPDAAAFTSEARGVLPPKIPMSDASANIGRTAMLVQALHTGDAKLMSFALDDRLHQPYRARLFPHLEPMIECVREAGAVGACLSGAGPTILSFAPAERAEQVAAAISAVATRLDVPGRVVTPTIDQTGIVVR